MGHPSCPLGTAACYRLRTLTCAAALTTPLAAFFRRRPRRTLRDVSRSSAALTKRAARAAFAPSITALQHLPRWALPGLQATTSPARCTFSVMMQNRASKFSRTKPSRSCKAWKERPKGSFGTCVYLFESVMSSYRDLIKVCLSACHTLA